jgi:hypothetical protein
MIVKKASLLLFFLFNLSRALYSQGIDKFDAVFIKGEKIKKMTRERTINISNHPNKKTRYRDTKRKKDKSINENFFDRNGNIALSIEKETFFSFPFKVEYIYNDKNLLMRSNITHMDANWSFSLYKYNDFDQKIEVTSYFSDTLKSKMIKYFYEEQKLIKEEEYLFITNVPKLSNVKYWEWVYDEEKQLVKKSECFKGSDNVKICYSTSYEYDPNGLLIREQNYKDSILSHICVYEYDKNIVIQNCEIIQNSDKFGSIKINKKHGERNLTYSININWNDNTITGANSFVYRNGLIKKEVSYTSKKKMTLPERYNVRSFRRIVSKLEYAKKIRYKYKFYK